MMLGRNTSTLPTPAMQPSTTRSLTQPSAMREPTLSPNHCTPASIQSMGYWPIVKVAQKMNHRRRMKMGKAAHWLVTMASMRSVMVRRGLSSWYLWYVSARAPWMKAYFASTIALSMEVPRRLSTRSFSSARASLMSWMFGLESRSFSISLSSSKYLIVRYLVEYVAFSSSLAAMKGWTRFMLFSISLPWLMWM